MVKTDTKGESYVAWKFICILDSRQCSDTPDETKYKLKWTSPWRATWQPALDPQDNLEELTEFHQKTAGKAGKAGTARMGQGGSRERAR